MFCYTFTNFYLSSIQQGIQTAHVQHELWLKYLPFFHLNDNIVGISPHESKMHHISKILKEWASDHKTMVVLNGGDNFALQDLTEFLCDKQNNMPWAHWRESEGALGGSSTAVSIIPDTATFKLIRMYKKGEIQLKEWGNKSGYNLVDFKKETVDSVSKFRGDLIRMIAKAELAR